MILGAVSVPSYHVHFKALTPTQLHDLAANLATHPNPKALAIADGDVRKALPYRIALFH